MYTSEIKTLQMDLVSSCNARCPTCFRQDMWGRPQPHYPKNQHLDLGLFEKALFDPSLKKLQKILLCGNYGDALGSPQLLQAIDLINRANPRMEISLHTNGSMGTKATWSGLGKSLNFPGRFVKFALDGLEDTNHLYRRGVSWQQAMENARIFIGEGGRAVWKFVLFEHNKHQIEEARALSQKMGFRRFEVVANYTADREPYISEAESLNLEIVEPDSLPSDHLSTEELDKTRIDCYAKKEQEIFLDFEGSVWPCCWIGGWKFASSSFIRKRHEELFLKFSKGDKEFNSLKKFSLSEILKHAWFDHELEESWQNPLSKRCGKTHFHCVEMCGSIQPAASR